MVDRGSICICKWDYNIVLMGVKEGNGMRYQDCYSKVYDS